MSNMILEIPKAQTHRKAIPTTSVANEYVVRKLVTTQIIDMRI